MHGGAGKCEFDLVYVIINWIDWFRKDVKIGLLACTMGEFGLHLAAVP